jgi:hypothetical protein
MRPARALRIDHGRVFATATSLAWSAGWSLVIVGFLSGTFLGLGFAREDFLGGYPSWRRRLVRLGHIACVMLGVLQMLFALSPAASAPHAMLTAEFWLAGSVSMPVVCWLAAWRQPLRALFFVPVLSLLAGSTLTILGVLSRS